MKAVMVCALTLSALVYGQDAETASEYKCQTFPNGTLANDCIIPDQCQFVDNETHGQSFVKADSRNGIIYKHWRRTRDDGQICTPGWKAEGSCQTCFCSVKGTEIICVNNGLCSHLPRYRRDIPSTESIHVYTNKSCVICTCEPNGLCAMAEFEICPIQKWSH